MDKRHTEGQICETILAEYLLRQDMYVFKPEATACPVDVIAISKNGTIYLLDAKKDATRLGPGRKNKQRIHRALTPFQRLLGVRMAYVDINTRNVQSRKYLQTQDQKYPQTQNRKYPQTQKIVKYSCKLVFI